jgi:hypothetical protein
VISNEDAALRCPKRSKKSPASFFHAASQAVRRELYLIYAELVAAYREALPAA